MDGSPAPCAHQWQRLWEVWDVATLTMIPSGRHTDRPFKLRQPFIFYLGHLPAFTDARLSEVLQQELTEPAHFAVMFARGIDPDLEDPTQCHSHSPTPPQWPSVPDILAYRDRVRARILQLYHPSQCTPRGPSTPAQSERGRTNLSAAAADTTVCDDAPQPLGTAHKGIHCRGDSSVIAAMPPALQHVLWMSYEHEAMHLETLVYLLAQYTSVRPPPQHLMPRVDAAAWCSALLVAPAVPKGASPAAAAAAASGMACGIDGSAAESADRSSGAWKAGSAADIGLEGTGSDVIAAALAGQLLLPLPPAAGWVQLPARTVTQGFTPKGPCSHGERCSSDMDTAEKRNSNSSDSTACGSGPLRFGWDNESPARPLHVASVQMQDRPVTVLEYLDFLADAVAAEAVAGLAGPPAPAVPLPNGAKASSSSSSSSTNHRPTGCGSDAGNHGMLASSGVSTAGYDSCSMTLLELMADYKHLLGAPRGCSCCQQALLQLLEASPAAAKLLPGSLLLLPLQTAEDSSCPEAAEASAVMGQRSTVGAAGSGSRIHGSCYGLCKLHKGGTWAPDSTCTTAAKAATFAVLQQAVCVRTVFGPVPISVAGYWPIYCSALQAEQYAAWLEGGCGSYRLPTEGEVLAARTHNRALEGMSSSAAAAAAPQQRQGARPEVATVAFADQGLWGKQTQDAASSAGTAMGDGVERADDSSSSSTSTAAMLPGTAAAVKGNVTGVDFAVWHQLCVSLRTGSLVASPSEGEGPVGQSDTPGHSSSSSSTSSSGSSGSSGKGGQVARSGPVGQLDDNGWEWTSSTFAHYSGFEPHPLYPEYSQDFFGGKHVVLLGASWATLDNLAQRPTFRNWYQKGQQHVFAKFRVCRVEQGLCSA